MSPIFEDRGELRSARDHVRVIPLLLWSCALLKRLKGEFRVLAGAPWAGKCDRLFLAARSAALELMEGILYRLCESSVNIFVCMVYRILFLAQK